MKVEVLAPQNERPGEVLRSCLEVDGAVTTPVPLIYPQIRPILSIVNLVRGERDERLEFDITRCPRYVGAFVCVRPCTFTYERGLLLEEGAPIPEGGVKHVPDAFTHHSSELTLRKRRGIITYSNLASRCRNVSPPLDDLFDVPNGAAPVLGGVEIAGDLPELVQPEHRFRERPEPGEGEPHEAGGHLQHSDVDKQHVHGALVMEEGGAKPWVM